MEPLILFCVGIIGIALLSALIRKFSEVIFPQKIFVIVVFPGIVLHEVFHVIASVIVGAKVRRINLFSLSGGSVMHEKPRLPFGQLLISFAPFIGGAAALFFVGRELQPFSLDGSQDRISTWRLWALLYVSYSVSCAMLPSWRDVKNSIFLICVLLATGVLVWFAGFRPLVENIEQVNRILFGNILPVLAGFFIISLLLYVMRRILKKG